MCRSLKVLVKRSRCEDVKIYLDGWLLNEAFRREILTTFEE